ncbi:unnamed protein product [Peniophora sp. CBMAI 1063]|nr:unnamed protein product [Peniophora sp. CBMAI 1063]
MMDVDVAMEDAGLCHIHRILTTDDILIEIFSYLPSFDSVGPWGAGSENRRPQILVASHVCRRWRELAIGCPDLWTHIVVVGPTWIELFIERSQTLPLTVTCHYPLKERSITQKKRVVCAIFNALPRICVLSVYDADWLLMSLRGHRECESARFDFVYEAAGRLLHSLPAFNHSDCSNTSHWPTGPTHLPTMLRRVDLTHNKLDAVIHNPRFFQAPLTSLTMDMVDVGTLTELVDALIIVQSTLNYLSMCRIWFSHPSDQRNMVPTPRSANMFTLQSLRIIEKAPIALALAESLILPPCLELVLAILPPEPKPSDPEWTDAFEARLDDVDDRVSQLLYSQYAAASAAGERFSALHIMNPTGPRFDSNRWLQYYDEEKNGNFNYEDMICCEMLEPETEGTLPARLTVALQYYGFAPDEAAMRLLDLFPPSNGVRTLYTSECLTDDWDALAQRAPAVEQIYMDAWVADEFEEVGGEELFLALRSTIVEDESPGNSARRTVYGMAMRDEM